MNSLGDTIKQARDRKGLSLRSLAQYIKSPEGGSLSPQYLNDIERGRRMPSQAVIEELARVLDLNKDELTLLSGQQLPEVQNHIEANPANVGEIAKAFRRVIKDLDK
jgi:transcriptional regulator with XRE-family HTH domain